MQVISPLMPWRQEPLLVGIVWEPLTHSTGLESDKDFKDSRVLLIANSPQTYFTIWYPWWRHQMETVSALQALCAGNSPVPGEFPSQRPVTRSFDVFLDLRLNKRLSKQPWSWWFETPPWSLWRQCNALVQHVGLLLMMLDVLHVIA